MRLKGMALAALAGAALAVALPGLSLWPLALLFPYLLLGAVERSRSRWGAAGLGWLAGTVHWLVSVNWVLPVMHHYGRLPLVPAVLCLLAMAGLLGLTWAVTCLLTSLSPAPWRVWTLPAAWSALEAFRQLPPYAFPWNPTAAALAGRPELLGSLPVWGATGLGWAIVAVGAGLWGLSRRDARRSGAVAVAAACGLTVAFTLLAPPARPSGAPLRVAVLQPGTSLEEKWDPERWQEAASRVWQLTRQAAADGAMLVLWPESAMPFSLQGDPQYRNQVVSAARELGISVVVNSIGPLPGDRYANSAYLVRGDGVDPTRYDKVRLVPFGEYVPLVARLAFTEALVREVPAFTPGSEPRLLPAGFPLGMSICYEVVFADLVGEQVRRGAAGLATITNDAWYGYSWAPRQHFAQAVLRAVENRRWLARAALTGISGFVDPSGRVTSRLPVGDHGFLAADVQPMSGLTPRARLRDWWGVLCGILAAALVVSGQRRAASGKR